MTYSNRSSWTTPVSMVAFVLAISACTEGQLGRKANEFLPPSPEARIFNARVLIIDPPNGTFVEPGTTSVPVRGTVEGDDAFLAGSVLTINGVPVPVNADGTWTTTAALDATANPVQSVVAAMISPSRQVRTDRAAVIRGLSVAKGSLAPQAATIQITDRGLDVIEPIAPRLLPIDVAGAVPVGTVIVNQACAARSPLGGCIDVVATVSGRPSVSSRMDVRLDAQNGSVRTEVTSYDMSVPVKLDALAHELFLSIPIKCSMRASIKQLAITGNFGMSPMAGRERQVDVAQVGDVSIALNGFSHTYDGADLCSSLSSVMDSIMGDKIKPLTENGMRNYLNRSTGGDTPIARLMQDAMLSIKMADGIGPALKARVVGEFEAINETDNYIAMQARTDITPACTPPAGAPKLGRVFAPPTAGSGSLPLAAPKSGTAHDILIATGPAAFNQLVRTLVECGMLMERVDKVALQPGTEPIALSTDLLSLLVGPRAAEVFGPGVPVYLQIRPTLAPFITGRPGAKGELAEMVIPHLELSYIVDNGDPAEEAELLRMAVDMRVGVNLSPEGQFIRFAIAPPMPEDVALFVTRNPLGLDPTALVALVPTLMKSVFPAVAERIPPFPIPPVAGLAIVPFEVSRVGDSVGIFGKFRP